MARMICVHVGLPKTATTTLQRALFANHSEIEFLGKCAGSPNDLAPRRCLNDAAFRLGDQLFWDQADAIDVHEAKRLYREEVLPAIAATKTPLFSFEGLAAAKLEKRQAIAKNLSEVFDRCRVVIGLRRPIDLVEAIYFQRLRRRHLGRLSANLKRIQSPSPEAWLESVVSGQELSDHLDYARTIRIFVEALGRENVLVMTLEGLKADPATSIGGLCEFLEIGKEEGLRHLNGPRHNTRMSQSLVDRMHRFERPGIGSALYSKLSARFRKRVLRIGQVEGGERAGLSIPGEIREAIDERTREGHRWIAEEWGVALGEYGYSV